MPEASTKETFLSAEEWLKKSQRHLETIRPWTHGYRQRRAKGLAHPVYDFLFQYYSFSTHKLETWHPPIGTSVEHNPQTIRLLKNSAFYQIKQTVIAYDYDRIPLKKHQLAQRILKLQSTIQHRPGRYNCYGLHEWAMLYKCNNVRHSQIPLRLSDDAIQSLVEQSTILCSHFDAFRFFTDAARPLNTLHPNADDREAYEQPACLHANMDLYKWATMLYPWSGSDLIAETFALAIEGRELDMRASPYDLRCFGYAPIPIETQEGKRIYERAQRQLYSKAQAIRLKLIASIQRMNQIVQ